MRALRPICCSCWIERRAYGKASGVELAFAVFGQERATDFLGEIFRREDMRAARAEVDGERLCPGFGGFLAGDVAVLGHLADDPVPPFGCLLLLAERMVVVGSFGQGREKRDLLDGEVLELLVEVGEACRGNSVGADAEIDLVEIEFEDLVLAVGALDTDGEDGFLDLAGERAVARRAGSSSPPAA